MSTTGELRKKLPSKIGGYKIESLLSTSGMSLIYLGIHPETHELIAIKVLSSKYLSRPEMVEQFMHEAAIIELTNHPNIVKLYGHGKWEGGVYIAMEFIQGISLRQMILQEAMSLKRALEIVIQIGYALTHLHAHGIIHRDLKLENILLTAQGGVKVIDFGISQLYTETAQAQIMGTPVYMSPEQQTDPLHVDFSTDIYALGIITYELVLGRLSHGVIHLSNMPRGLQKILAQALQPQPKDRYEDIVDFVTEISHYLSSDELIRDRRGSDYLGELSSELREAQGFFLPRTLPSWPPVEMAFASNCTTALAPIYYDFCSLRDGIYTIVLGESHTPGVKGVLHTALLKGMVSALTPSLHQPQHFLSTLNKNIQEETEPLLFTFLLLTLSPKENRFSYISCGYNPLWYRASSSGQPRRLRSDNPPLGRGGGTEFIEVSAKWEVGDSLILHTFQARQTMEKGEQEKDEALFHQAFLDNLFVHPKQQADAIFRKVTQKSLSPFFERPITIVAIERIT